MKESHEHMKLMVRVPSVRVLCFYKAKVYRIEEQIIRCLIIIFKLQCDPFLQWIQSNQGRLVQHSFVNYYKTIDGNEMLAYLKSKGIVPSSLSVFGVGIDWR